MTDFIIQDDKGDTSENAAKLILIRHLEKVDIPWVIRTHLEVFSTHDSAKDSVW